MKKYRLLATTTLAVTALTLTACGNSDVDTTAPAGDTTSQSTSDSPTSSTSSSSNENLELVTDFYNDFFNDHDISAADVISDDYIQHNPQVPDGKAPFVDYFAGYFQDNPDYRGEIKRSAVNDDLVFLHVHSTNDDDDTGQAVVDIFRVDDGIIVEHWDVLQDVPEDSANDNTMF
ncbi:nuclear transport factor 2 family protein [Corynebacterium kalidii]|uniref:Nuclear transport factor 2 family protein n=1 Tax=Corynebacterium kalidii TaxID=2931982 RepID=A0A9X2B2N5_9CORY|nr:nuclear transport factor 2 family protein [Corynebacterium kalidii]MCJ7858960.1 nuclear transport factor 2 family protein [Corynebacterium kalidii]